MRSLFSFWTNFQIKSQMPGAYRRRKQTCDNQNKYGKQDHNDEMIIFEMSSAQYECQLDLIFYIENNIVSKIHIEGAD